MRHEERNLLAWHSIREIPGFIHFRAACVRVIDMLVPARGHFKVHYVSNQQGSILRAERETVGSILADTYNHSVSRCNTVLTRSATLRDQEGQPMRDR